jgi:hypothetical protein
MVATGVDKRAHGVGSGSIRPAHAQINFKEAANASRRSMRGRRSWRIPVLRHRPATDAHEEVRR